MVMVVLLFVSPLSSRAQVPGPNLLSDGNFEAPTPWPKQDSIDEVQVASGWRAWYLDVAPSTVKAPSNCSDSGSRYDCYWMRPEFVDSVRTGSTNRIYSGNNSQKYFSINICR